jgi:hypothetical protein
MSRLRAGFIIITATTFLSSASARAAFGPEEIIRAGGVDVAVPGFSVPSLADWNGDGLPDCIVGEGGLGTDAGKVRVYLNVGTISEPAFSHYLYIQSGGSDIEIPSGG